MKKIYKQSIEELFNLINAIILVLDAKGKIQFINRKGSEILGYKKEELIGKNWFNLCVPKEKVNEVKSVHGCNISGKIKESYENLIITKSNEKKVISWVNTILKDEKGNIKGSVSYGWDITQRKEFEKKIIEERNKAQKYLDLAGSIILAVDRKANVTLINKKGCEVLGYPEKDIIGKNWIEEFIPHDYKKQLREYKKQLLSKNPKVIEHNEIPVKTKYGRKLIAWNNILITDDDGRTVSHLSSGEDITEKKKADEEIKRTKEMLQRIIDLLPVRIFWKDKKLNYSGCNLAFAKDAGKKTPEELIGKSDYELSWREQAENYRNDDREVIKSGKSKINYEMPQTTSSGDKIWLLTTKVPLIDESGKAIGIIGMYSDITEKKTAEEELEQFNRFAIGRELKMVELKKEVNELLKQLNKPPKYDVR